MIPYYREDMKKSALALLLLITLSASELFACMETPLVSAQSSPSVYFGVDIAYGGVSEAKAAIDQVKDYTNFVVLGSTGVTWFQARVNETYQYAYDQGLYFASLRPSLPQYSSMELNETEWLAMAPNRWGNQLLGFYILDEPGGRQLDSNFQYAWNNYTGYPTSYSSAAYMFTQGVKNFLSTQKPPSPYLTFTSDYGLYWYDYKAGYDVVWTELGGNYSQQINIALCRAAATAQGKDWGAIITWSYTNPPYIESGSDLYDDLVLAYDNGAKYIVIFDSDEKGNSILQAEHHQAMQQFYSYMQSHPPKSAYPKSERVGFVLPDAWGFGFRWPTDHIWGLWDADELTANISRSVATLLEQYGERLDILYNDGLTPDNNGYSQLLYWDVYDPTPTATPSPSPTPTPTASPNPTPPTTAVQSETLIGAVVIGATAALVSVVVFTLVRKPKSPKPHPAP
jgi:hypothetical protein